MTLVAFSGGWTHTVEKDIVKIPVTSSRNRAFTCISRGASAGEITTHSCLLAMSLCTYTHRCPSPLGQKRHSPEHYTAEVCPKRITDVFIWLAMPGSRTHRYILYIQRKS